MKQVHEQWGFQYHRTSNLETNKDGNTVDLTSSVADFLPGGLTVRLGPIVGRWVLLESVTNNINEPMTWKQAISKKIGFDKETCMQIASKNTNTTESLGGTILPLLKAQFTLPPLYGGCSLDCSKEGWSDENTMDEIFGPSEIREGKTLYVWQYTYCMGDREILYSKDTVISTTDTSPSPKGML